jgi:hypothetical protein
LKKACRQYISPNRQSRQLGLMYFLGSYSTSISIQGLQSVSVASQMQMYFPLLFVNLSPQSLAAPINGVGDSKNELNTADIITITTTEDIAFNNSPFFMFSPPIFLLLY